MTSVSQSTRNYVVNHATTALASVLALWSLACGEGSILPSSYHSVTPPYSNRYPWETSSRNPYYTILEHIDEDYQKLEIISDFAAKLLADSEDLDPSYGRIVSKKFWDLF
ncbi:MAG: hypothetical protein CVU64_17195 [Deltaproteobacteria bacterium HGW-Deltaproteobacteria-21]|jgi:hypothetical protein|nr:MAG: hypothetical protein CVU64_17195 [Deltaproteobacteria bacterium HGW-Deltaproteobacteria-21]